jgi:hypothetical protein
MQIPSGISTRNILMKMSKIPLTFPPADVPPGVPSSCIHTSLALSKKYTPLYPTTHQLHFWAFPHPHQSPPSSLDCLNRRNLVLQLQFLLSLLLRFMILFLWWILLKLCPIIIHSAAHNLQTFVLAVFMRLIVFQCHNISTLIFDWHHSATLALVLNLMIFTWKKRWWARAEQFSCFAPNWCHVSFGVAVGIAMDWLSNITSGDGPVSMGLVLSSSNGVLDCMCMVSPTWGGGALSITTHIAGDCGGTR